MRILVTGNMGYVGPAIVRHLRQRHPDAAVFGFDSGYFAHCLTNATSLPEAALDRQYFGDVREFPGELLEGIDAVVHLAAISNDPMGNKFADVTETINYRASARIATLARDYGITNFVFASSCSVYGEAAGGARIESDPVNPLTAYARSKIATERALSESNRGEMAVTCLRFATACGMSERLRLDLVLNDFVAGAVSRGEITVLSDGTPWRPLIDVKDMARAIDWAVTRKADNGGALLTVNVGPRDGNYQVKDLANAVAAAVPGVKVSINTAAPPDKRSYKVDFGLFHKLAPQHAPQVGLDQSIVELRKGLTQMGFANADFRNSEHMRLKVLETHIAAGRLSPDLRWASAQDRAPPLARAQAS